MKNKNEVNIFLENMFDCLNKFMDKLDKIEETFFNEIFCDHYEFETNSDFDSDETILESDDESTEEVSKEIITEVPKEVIIEVHEQVPEKVSEEVIEEFHIINDEDLIV